MAWKQGEYAQARMYQERARALAETALEPDDPYRGDLATNLANLDLDEMNDGEAIAVGVPDPRAGEVRGRTGGQPDQGQGEEERAHGVLRDVCTSM